MHARTSAINIAYYDYSHLLERIGQQRAEKPAETLVLTCRGNSPPTCEIEEILEDQRLNIAGHVPIRLPCSGRVPTSLVFGALKKGFKNVISVQCEPHFCPFKDGTKISTRRLALRNALLSQLAMTRTL